MRMAYRQVARRGVLGFELTPPDDVVVTPSNGGAKIDGSHGGVMFSYYF